MKRAVSILLLVALMLSFATLGFAERDFKISSIIVGNETETKAINVIFPNFEGFNGAEELNERVINMTLDSIGVANAADKSLEDLRQKMSESGEPYKTKVELDVDYDYTKEGDILSVRLINYIFAGGAHGMTYLTSITTNASTGEIYEFKNLFKVGIDYNSTIKEILFKEIEKNPEIYFSEYKETIINKDGDYNFYIDGDRVVVYFDLYEIAPYASGIRQFAIDSNEIKGILKDEIYSSIKDGKERNSIIVNGASIETNKELITKDNGVFLPLRAIAESLGYTVDWNRNDGAIVDNNPIKNLVEDYTLIDNTTYVPQSYFIDILGEYISLGYNSNDELIARVFSKENIAKHPYDKIHQFQKPLTQEEAINMYAKGVDERAGFIQYGLMDDQLRTKNYEFFKDLNFVTGTSSPWVDSYKIIQVNDNNYKVEFTLKTSNPSDELISTVNIKLAEDGEFINIINIEEE